MSVVETAKNLSREGADPGQCAAPPPGRKRIVVLAQTEVYARRLRDPLPLLESDPRIEVVFTVAPHACSEGAARFPRGLGATVLPWDEAVRTPLDLAPAAGSRGMERIQAPLIRIPRGGGHLPPARVPEGPEGQAGQAGAREVREPGGITGRAHPTWNGVVVPRAVALPHSDGLDALARWCPEALPVAEVVGDPCYDRIAASLPYRERYRVALLVHPNVWPPHGHYQVRAWLADCRRAGVIVLPPDVEWWAPLVAADSVIGDYGSVTLYASMTGAPVLLTRYRYQDADPVSPGVAMALATPALTRGRVTASVPLPTALSDGQVPA